MVKKGPLTSGPFFIAYRTGQVVRPNLSPVFLKLQANLAGERSVSGFRPNLSESTGVDIQVRVCRRRVIEEIASVEPDGHASGFCDSDFLLQIRIETPTAGSIDRVQTQRAQLSGRRILQEYVFSVGIGRNRGVAAERSQV